MKLSIEVDTDVAAMLQGIEREKNLPDTESTIRYLISYYRNREFEKEAV